MLTIFETIVIIVAIIISLSVLGFVATGLRLINLPLYQFNGNVDRATSIIDKINNPKRCLTINKEFQELKAEIIQVRNTQISNSKYNLENFKKGLPEDRTKWDFNTTQAYNQMNGQLLGQQQYLSSLEGKYNSFLNRQDTAPCRSNLPTFIDLK